MNRTGTPAWMDLNASEPPEAVVLPVDVRVKQGMALLDEKHGPGWVHKIDVDTLDISSGCLCVLGQVYPSRGDLSGYGVGAEKLGISGLASRDHGFLATSDRVAVTVAWRSAILARRLDEVVQ